jgi:hypothetical protein
MPISDRERQLFSNFKKSVDHHQSLNEYLDVMRQISKCTSVDNVLKNKRDRLQLPDNAN